MTVNVCPADRVEAPADVVWALLADPAGYERFWDFTVQSLDPPGPATAGQRFVGWSRALFRRWRFEGEILEVDPPRRQIRFRTILPFGVTGDNRIACTPIDARSCMLRYG